MSDNQTKTVLIIDDSPDDLEFYSRLLGRAGAGRKYTVLTAQDAEQGLKLFDQNDIDCSIVDYNLPDRDGLATVRALQQRAGKRNGAPVVILTGQPKQEIQAEAARSAAFDYVVKDAITSTAQLERVILKAISWSESGRF
jgi:CheY-like chemotaxis protein